jgi:UDP-glucose 4-epimerase
LINLLEEAKKYSLKQVLFASSGGAIYGEAVELPTSENYRPRPASPYGISKYTSELYLDYYWQVYRIPYIALRYGNVYGPRQNPHGEAGVIAIFTSKVLRNESATINGDGKQQRDFVYVGDVVNANVKALGYPEPLVVNIGTSVASTVNEVFDILIKETKTAIKRRHGSAKLGEQKISHLNISLANEKLAWKPHVSLEQGLRETVEYFRNEKQN